MNDERYTLKSINKSITDVVDGQKLMIVINFVFFYLFYKL